MNVELTGGVTNEIAERVAMGRRTKLRNRIHPVIVRQDCSTIRQREVV